MTTIAYRNGVIAGDTLVTSNGIRVGRTVKVAKKGGALAGIAGSLEETQPFLQWFHNGMNGDPPPIPDESSCGFVAHGPRILTWCGTGWDHIDAPYHAIGSGGRFALAAMACGRSPRQAVKVASTFDVYTGTDIIELRAK